MGRGRKAKPVALKVLAGNPGQRRLGREPQPVAGVPDCPDYLNDDARREWGRIVPELARMGLLTVVDGSALEAHCANYARAVCAERTIEREGITLQIQTDAGVTVRKNPACTVADSCWRLVRSFLSELGLSPASRAKLGNLNSGESDPLDEWDQKTA